VNNDGNEQWDEEGAIITRKGKINKRCFCHCFDKINWTTRGPQK
jgi:hypothetical protein